MARKRMVTRTITATVATVVCADLTDNTVCNEVVTLSGRYKNMAAALKAAKRKMDSDEKSVLKVIDMNEVTNLYGMPESDFIEQAELINK